MGLLTLASATTWVVLTVCPAESGRNFAFLVAAQDYDRAELKPLNFTRNDITAFSAALVQVGYKKEHIVLMHDRQERRFMPEATKILTEFDLLLSSVEEDDSIIVALAGHGITIVGESKSYFCPVDAKLEDRSTLIAFDDIYDRLEKCPAARKLLLIDACRNDPQSDLARNRARVKLESVTRPQAQAVPKGIVALFSCDAGQRSFELPELKHGIFFYNVLEAMKGRAVRDGATQITLDDLIRFTRQETQTLARTKLKQDQIPESKGSFAGVWVLRDLGSMPLERSTTKKATSKTENRKPTTEPKGKSAESSVTKKSPAVRSFNNTSNMKFVLIDAGEFNMGSNADPSGAATPRHTVVISRPFYVGVHEVTKENFKKFVTETRHKTDAEKSGIGGEGIDVTGTIKFKPEYTWMNLGRGFVQKDNHPVVNVSWNDAQAYCEWLSGSEEAKRKGYKYRLPYEAEWELACRANTTADFYNGDNLETLRQVSNSADKQHRLSVPLVAGTASWDDKFPFTAPVGSFESNEFGLLDMHGNVWEWCMDRFEPGYYQRAERVDPKGPNTGESRVARGGSFRSTPTHCSSWWRQGFAPRGANCSVGFRVVCETQ